MSVMPGTDDMRHGAMLRVSYHAALATAQEALVELADGAARAMGEIAEALRSRAPERAAFAAAGIAAVKYDARELANRVVMLMWRQQPLAREFERVMMMYELALDYERLAHDLAMLRSRLYRLDRSILAGAPWQIDELAGTAQQVTALIHEGVRNGTAGPLLRVNSERDSAEAICTDVIAELQYALQDRQVRPADGCPLLVIVLSLQSAIRQAASAARHGRAFVAAIS
jgi:hypothetical protein